MSGRFDISFCHNRLAIAAGVLTAKGVSDLVAVGVTHLLTFRRYPWSLPGIIPDFHFPIVCPQIVLLWNPVEDDGEPKPFEWFERSLRFAMSALAIPGTRVCCHCYEGSNRSPSTALAILLAQGLGFEQALSLVLAARSQAKICYREDARGAVMKLGYG